MEDEPPNRIVLSVVVPAFNEMDRLPAFLEASRPYLDGLGFPYELLIVDDGSGDGTFSYAQSLSNDWSEVRALTNGVNLGKGAAVRRGVLASAGDYVLFCDADGATAMSEETRLRRWLETGWDAAIGSRALHDPGVERKREPGRAFAGKVFAGLARIVLNQPFRDPQCGFKMFTRAAARRVFAECREDRFLFDLEVLGLCRRFGLRVKEVAINWSEQPGSKIALGRDAPRMIADLWRLRRQLAAAERTSRRLGRR